LVKVSVCFLASPRFDELRSRVLDAVAGTVEMQL